MYSRPSQHVSVRLVQQMWDSYLSAALTLYEYLLTLDAEVEQYWNRKATAASVLFFLNRYVSIVNRIGAIMSLLSWKSNIVCGVVFSPTI